MQRFTAICRYRLRSLLLAMTVLAIGLCIWVNWELIPGTYYRDENGFPHGTGTQTYKYDNGKLMLKEWYRAGLIYRSTWYRPDGSEIATQEFDKSTGGIGYYLNQDGTIKSKVKYAYYPSHHDYLANGNAIYYRADGTVEKAVRYKAGVKIEP